MSTSQRIAKMISKTRFEFKGSDDYKRVKQICYLLTKKTNDPEIIYNIFTTLAKYRKEPQESVLLENALQESVPQESVLQEDTSQASLISTAERIAGMLAKSNFILNGIGDYKRIKEILYLATKQTNDPDLIYEVYNIFLSSSSVALDDAKQEDVDQAVNKFLDNEE